jgi:hypothetical protein
MKTRPAAIFLGLTLLIAVLLAAYLLHVKRRNVVIQNTPAAAPEMPAPATPADPAPATREPAAAAPAAEPKPASNQTPAPAAAAPRPRAPARPSRLFFRHTGVDQHYGKVAWTDTAQPRVVNFVDTMACEVVYVSGGHGICLSADRGVFTTYAASLFDPRTFEVKATMPLKGIPSRARISIDGELAAFTVFVSGHGYTTLDFSTQTLLVNTRNADVIADLETFVVRKDGTVIESPDFNFWGVTFTPDARQFYATLSTKQKHFLVRGDIASRSAEVIHENVECPSLSPDATKVAYKKRLMVGNRIVWQLQVLDLATHRETALSERRSIDDQLEWLDDAHVLYSVPAAEDGSSPSTDVWVAPVDAKSRPRVYQRNAYSPASARCKDEAACAAPSRPRS